MHGHNKGKKYVKLQGYEEPTEESEAMAKAFMDWYGANYERLRDRLIYPHLYDAELATDTALLVYDNISLKRFKVHDYQSYFLRAYHTNRLAKFKSTSKNSGTEDPYRELSDRWADFDEDTSDNPLFQLTTEMLEYVRANYDPLSVSLFEIYVGLLPDTSYKRLSELLGIPVTRVWTSLGLIRKDLAVRFKTRKDFLLSSD